MIRVALVDDEPKCTELLSVKMEEYFSEKNIKFDVAKFYSGQELLETKTDIFDIIFMDIDMPGLNGMETSRKLIKTNTKSKIIFCTYLEEYAINGYEVNAIGYLLKPILDYPFRLNMDKAYKLISNNRIKKLKVKTIKGCILLAVQDILYVEVQRHNLFFNVLKDGVKEVVRSRGTMQEISNILKWSNFVRCSTCYLVNLEKVESIGGNEVRLFGESLPISRTCKNDFTEKFMAFLLDNEA